MRRYQIVQGVTLNVDLDSIDEFEVLDTIRSVYAREGSELREIEDRGDGSSVCELWIRAHGSTKTSHLCNVVAKPEVLKVSGLVDSIA